jgi:hypothetical protein
MEAVGSTGTAKPVADPVAIVVGPDGSPVALDVLEPEVGVLITVAASAERGVSGAGADRGEELTWYWVMVAKVHLGAGSPSVFIQIIDVFLPA